MNIKLLVLVAFVVGSTIGAMVAANAKGSTGGCDFLGSKGDSAVDSPNVNSDSSSNSNANASPTNANNNGSGGTNQNTNVNSDGGTTNSNANVNANANENTNTNSGGNTNNNTNTNGNGGTIALTGTYSGTVVCATSQRVGQTNTPPRNRNVFVTMNFDSQGLPVDLPIPGFSGAPETRVAIQTVGEQATANSQNGTIAVTTVARVTEATYTPNSARVVLAITYTGLGGSLTQNGTATETLEVSVSGNTLMYSLDIVYSVMQTGGGINLDTGETHDCNGTLNRQAPNGSGGAAINNPAGG